MAIRIIEDNSKIEDGAKYKVTCPKCGVVIEYLGVDVQTHKNFPRGFIYCPKCNQPIAHDENSFTGEVVENPKPYSPEDYKRMILFIVLTFIAVAAIVAAVFITLVVTKVI